MKNLNLTLFTIGIICGLGLGVTLGVLFDKIGLGIVLGLSLGVGIGFLLAQKNEGI